MVEYLVIAWGWEEYGKQSWIWGKPIFGENQFWLLGQVITQKCMPFSPTWTFFIFLAHIGKLASCLTSMFLLAKCFSFTIGHLGISIIIIHHRWGSLKWLGTRSSHLLILLSRGFVFGDDMWLGSFPQCSVAFPQCLSSWKSFLCSQHCNCGVWNSFLATLGPKRPRDMICYSGLFLLSLATNFLVELFSSAQKWCVLLCMQLVFRLCRSGNESAWKT